MHEFLDVNGYSSRTTRGLLWTWTRELLPALQCQHRIKLDGELLTCKRLWWHDGYHDSFTVANDGKLGVW